MTREERKIALHCLKAYSDYHSEVCEECINYPNCDHTMQDDVTETIIKALEQESRKGKWEKISKINNRIWCKCSLCQNEFEWNTKFGTYNYCPNCGAKMAEREE